MSDSPSEFRRLEELYREAQSLDGSARLRFLSAILEEDAELAGKLRGLLRVDDVTEDFLAGDTVQAVMSESGGSAQIAAGDRIADYEVLDAIAAGGMGTVFRARQEALRRTVALKVMHAGLHSKDSLRRFELESEILANLRHPGIAQVFDAGVHEGAGGSIPYFAMEYIDGPPLTDHVRRADLDVEAILRLMASVADAVDHAHQRGIVHRDLKPSNILVDSSGQPKVLDFGVARAAGSELQVTSPMTQEGMLIGTIRYMSPEQTEGDPSLVDQRSDIYALGVILFELLSGRSPYELDGTSIYEAVRTIRHTEPRELSSFNPALRGDVETIVGKALEKEKGRRYASAAALSADLRRHLDHEPIEARPPSATYKLRKFVKRNRWFVGSATAVLLALSVGLLIAIDQRDLARRNEGLATREAREKTLALNEVRRLSDLEVLQRFREDSDRLWPTRPELLPELEAVIETGRDVVSRKGRHAERLAELRKNALPYEPERKAWDHRERLKKISVLKARLGGIEQELLGAEEERKEPLSKALEFIEGRLAELEQEVAVRGSYQFETPAEEWEHGILVEVVALTDRFLSNEGERGTLADFIRRRDFAADLTKRTISDQSVAWAEAIERVSVDPRFEGLALKPQPGLIPLGPDPDTALEEFLHLESHAGEIPTRDDQGALQLADDFGVILVLVPGGAATIGAQASDPTGKHFDPNAAVEEGPVHTIRLKPFLMAKFELTQAQWKRWTGRQPSQYHPGTQEVLRITDRNPVESVSWFDCTTVARQMGLRLPTEVQWEYAARAGTNTSWWTGDERDSLRGAVNLADQTAASLGVGWAAINEWPGFDDGYCMHAPVSSMRANGFGLHHVHGNVFEWCRDRFTPQSYSVPVSGDDAERQIFNADLHVIRGGSFINGPSAMRISLRASAKPELKNYNLGCRLSRALD